jgi:hypothetical protein
MESRAPEEAQGAYVPSSGFVTFGTSMTSAFPPVEEREKQRKREIRQLETLLEQSQSALSQSEQDKGASEVVSQAQ